MNIININIDNIEISDINVRKNLIKNIEESNQSIIIKNKNTYDNQTNEHKLCAICLTQNRNCVLVHSNDTAHMVSCYDCAKILKSDNLKCPICREDILSINIVYIS